MSLTAESTKDNEYQPVKAELIYSEKEDARYAASPINAHAIDITPILETMPHIEPSRIHGVRVQSSNGSETYFPLYPAEMQFKLSDRLNFILDAIIVNEKQKKATSALIFDAINDVFDRYEKVFDLARTVLKKSQE